MSKPPESRQQFFREQISPVLSLCTPKRNSTGRSPFLQGAQHLPRSQEKSHITELQLRGQEYRDQLGAWIANLNQHKHTTEHLQHRR